MNILTISNCILTKTQGSGNVILNYTEGLKKLGHSVKIYSPDSFPSLKILRNRAYIYRFALLSLITIISELYLKKNRYDVIEFYGEENWLSILFLSIIGNKQTFIHHSNGPSTIEDIVQKDQKRSLYIQFLFFLKKTSITKAKKIVLVSLYCYQHVIQDLKINKEKVTYINNGLEDTYLNMDIDYSLKENIILFVGNFIPIKGKNEFVKTINLIFTQHTNWIINIIGNNNPEDIKLFKEDIRHKIHFTPTIKDRYKLSLIYRKAKILFMPSIIETFGLVFCEAMAHKCVVVSSNVGFLVECDNQEVLKCEKNFSIPLKSILDNESQLRQIAYSGYEKVQSLNWSVAVGKYETLLKKMINDRS